MKIKVEVMSWFTRFTGGRSSLELDLPPGSEAGAAAREAGIPEEEMGFITVNGLKVEKEHILAEGDSLKIYPLIIGG